MQNIPTLQPANKSTKAVFEARDVQNTFERDIKARHEHNFAKYVNNKLRG